MRIINMARIEKTDREDYKYNVQIWKSTDGGKSWNYTGNGKFCQKREEIDEVVKKYNAINSMCVKCKNLGGVCSGTTCQIWTGCINRKLA